jgi:hypothetical protein
LAARLSASIGLSNENWNILDKTFAPIYVQLQVLSATQQLQRYATVFRNVLASNQHAVVEEATYFSLICYEDFLWTKKQQAIFCCMVGKSSWQPYAQQGLGLIWSGPLRLALGGAPVDVIHHFDIDTLNAMTEVTNNIQMLLNVTGRSEHSCPPYNECVVDMKAEMGSSCKAMIRSGISFDKLPKEQKQKDASTNGRQKNNFAGTAKKRNGKDKVVQRSLVAVEEKDSVSDSYEDTQSEFGRVAIVNKPQKYLSPRIINTHPRMAEIKRHDFDRIQQIKES